jgi:cytochrome c-type biogenesis protein
MTLFFLAILGGLLTVLAPCVLPILPIVLATGSGSRWRPVFVVVGFVLSFSVLGAAFAVVGSFLGVSDAAFRWIAVVLLACFGLALLFENAYERLIARASAWLGQLGARVGAGSIGKSSALSGLLVGVSLGIVWTPCAGPILGTILTLAATRKDLLVTTILFGAYAIGAGLPMLGIAYGGSWVMRKLKLVGERAALMNRVFGVLILLTAVAIATGYDQVLAAGLLRFYPSGTLPL